MNDRFSFGGFRIRTIKMPAWQIAVIGAAAAAVVITLAIVATGVFLLVFPAILVIDWLYRWRTRRTRASTPSPERRETVITTDYEVLPPDPDFQDRTPRS